MQNLNRLLTEREAAEYLSISVYWLQKVRSQRRPGPAVTRVGSAIRYSISALDEYLRQVTTGAISEQNSPPGRAGATLRLRAMR